MKQPANARPANRIIRLVPIERPAEPAMQELRRAEQPALSCDPYNHMGRSCAEMIYRRLR